MPHALHVSVSVSVCLCVCVRHVAGGEKRQLLKCNRCNCGNNCAASSRYNAHILRIRHVVHTTQNGFDSTVTAQRGAVEGRGEQ